MAISIFIRCSHFRRLIGISNNAAALFPDAARHSNHIKSRSYTSISEIIEDKSNTKKSEKKISKAMLMYLQRAKEHDEFMKKEVIEYEIGKRHLANMMGEDPECFTQADIDRSIQYLFPSGLFDPKARPIMEHPEKIFPSRKAAEFDESGRPFHSMFYTSKPNYYETLYNIVDKIKSLNDIEDSLIRQGTLPMDKVGYSSDVKLEIYVEPYNYRPCFARKEGRYGMDLASCCKVHAWVEEKFMHVLCKAKQDPFHTVPAYVRNEVYNCSIWLPHHEIEKLLLESLHDLEYNYFITSLERLCDHPLSRRTTDFIMKYRKILNTHSNEAVIPLLEHDSTGRPYTTVKNCMRKSARGEVTIWGNGSGKITINGRDITYFEEIYHRQQVEMVDSLSHKFISFSPAREMEETGEKVSKTVPAMLTRTSAASLFLTRLKTKRSSSKQDDNELESARVQYESPSLPDNSLSPICSMEDYSVISERASSEEVNRTFLRINEDFIKNILTEHRKRVGCKSQVWENLESGKTDETNVETIFAAIKSNEINVLLLQASFAACTDLIYRLCKRGANVNYTEPDHGLTPLHLCAFRNCLDGVKYLIEQGASVDTKSKHTPFHYAAFGDAFDVAQYFVQRGVSQLSPHDAEETVLHVAARTNASRVLSLLAPNNKELDRLDQDGYAAIHHAADGGNMVCLDILLKTGCQVDLPTGKNDTALHLAAEAGCADNLALLVEVNANLQLKNHRGHTALHLAARSHSVECVEILLKGRADPNVEDDEGRTPLHLALGKSLMTDDITELLLKWRADVNKADKYGYTPLHIAASNELSRCVNLLIKYEADLSARTIGGNSALSVVLRKTPMSLDVFERRLDKSLTLSRHGFVAGELELQLDFRPLLQHRRNRQIRSPEIGYLNTFVKEGYKEVLEHPLCQSFLHLKWHKIRKYYAARLLFYLVYVLILTSWVITALAHNCYNESKGYMHEPPLCANATGIYELLYRHPAVLEVQWYALMVLTVLEACRKFSVLPSYRSVRQFFTQMENLVEWCVILSVFATSFVYTGRTYVWQSHVGAFAVLCGWSNLMLMIGQLPVFGAYVAMFTSVQAQVFKLLLAYACLLVGFTASFCVIFPHSKSFGSPHTGLIKVLAMMTGELGFEDLFFSPDKGGVYENVGGTSWILLQISAQLSFVLFLLFVTIVLMNLLIGIAVHDIKGLQKTAGLAKLVRQTKLIHDVEIAIFLGFTPSKRFIKCLRWTALLLPSPLRAVLTVRPLNPREKRLPRDVLSAAYKIAKERDGQNNFAVTRKKTYGQAYYAKATSKGDVTACRRRGLDDDTLQHDCSKFKDDIAELREICEKNHTLLRELVKAQSSGKINK